MAPYSNINPSQTVYGKNPFSWCHLVLTRSLRLEIVGIFSSSVNMLDWSGTPCCWFSCSNSRISLMSCSLMGWGTWGRNRTHRHLGVYKHTITTCSQDKVPAIYDSAIVWYPSHFLQYCLLSKVKLCLAQPLMGFHQLSSKALRCTRWGKWTHVCWWWFYQSRFSFSGLLLFDTIGDVLLKLAL